AANWSPASVPSAPGAQVIMGTAATSPATVTLGGNQNVGSLTFNNTAGYTLASGSLTFQGAGTSAAALTVLSGSHTIGAAIVLASGLPISEQLGTRLTVSGNISGNQSLTLSGSGELV